MFHVEADSFAAYQAVDPLRKPCLLAWDGLMASNVPDLKPYFHAGTPKGQPGMRFKMLGYGLTRGGAGVEWPRVGLALQKNYISVYVLDHAALEPFRGRLGELRMGQGNFSFVRFADLRADVVATMLGRLSR